MKEAPLRLLLPGNAGMVRRAPAESAVAWSPVTTDASAWKSKGLTIIILGGLERRAPDRRRVLALALFAD
jgi:hypothetical protein